ncbi:PI-PLC domain-containing protein [Marinomonas epiphytica]
MEIISHRGYWVEAHEKNTSDAFSRSFSLGFGTETDLRDANGQIVISHDIPSGEEMKFSDLLQLYNAKQCSATLALNIKADGLQDKVVDELKRFNISNYFVFDMSVPDALVSIRAGLNCYARFSEYEPESCLWKLVRGIWYDSFDGGSFEPDLVEKLILEGKEVCIVSSELHGRDHMQLWQEINCLSDETLASERLILCTDIPEIARDYFK